MIQNKQQYFPMTLANCKNCTYKSCLINSLLFGNNSIQPEVALVNYRKNEILKKQGTFANHILFVRKGYVKLYRECDDKNLVLKIVAPETSIGIEAISGNKINQYSVSSINNSEVCQIDRKTIIPALANNTDALERIFNSIYTNEQELLSRFTSLTQKQLHGRLADAILYLSDQVYKSDNFEFYLTRKDLAELTSMSTESAIKIFKEFQNDNLVSLENNRLQIISKDLLQRISDIG